MVVQKTMLVVDGTVGFFSHCLHSCTNTDKKYEGEETGGMRGGDERGDEKGSYGVRKKKREAIVLKVSRKDFRFSGCKDQISKV